jgi:transcriptional regulator with XRE-family HTH domain
VVAGKVRECLNVDFIYRGFFGALDRHALEVFAAIGVVARCPLRLAGVVAHVARMLQCHRFAPVVSVLETWGVCILPGNINRQRGGNMQATIILLDKYKSCRSIDSDLACAKSLSVGRAAVSKWRNGSGHPDADSVEKMCDAIGEPLRAWLPLIEAERARTPAIAKVWLRLAQASAALAVIAIFSRIDGHSCTDFASFFAVSNLYIMRN